MAGPADVSALNEQRDAVLDELEERLAKADETLRNQAKVESYALPRWMHLMSKADGVRLALSYVQEMKRR